MCKKSKWMMSVLMGLVIGLTACGSTTEVKKVAATEDDSVMQSTVADDSTEETADEKIEATKSEKVDVTIDETMLVDQDGIKVTALEYVSDDIWGDGIKLVIENTSDTDYTVSLDALIVNDYMLTDFFSAEVAAGKKANETMYLSSTSLEAAGIENVGKIEAYFKAYDSDWNNKFSKVYAELKTSAYDKMDTQTSVEGMELYNEGGIRIVGQTVDEDSFWGTAILMYCENTTDKNIGISVENMSINGYMMDPLFYADLYAGKKIISELTLLSTDLEENGIEKIEEVELQFNIVNSDTYDTIANTEPITFTAK